MRQGALFAGDLKKTKPFQVSEGAIKADNVRSAAVRLRRVLEYYRGKNNGAMRGLVYMITMMPCMKIMTQVRASRFHISYGHAYTQRDVLCLHTNCIFDLSAFNFFTINFHKCVSDRNDTDKLGRFSISPSI